VKVVWNYVAGPAFERRLAALADQGLDVAVCPESDHGRLVELLAEAEVLWHCLRPVDARLLEAAPRLRLVQKIGVGVNTIDLDTARARNVAVCNMPGTNSRAVAEHTLALMLAVLRQVPRFDADVRAGRGWSWPAPRQDALGELGGRTVGLVGYGSVPRVLAPVLTTLGARVVYTARSPKPDVSAHYRELESLLAEADVVSLHVPLRAETEGLLDARRLALLRPGAVLINTARGALVDETALRDALAQGRLAGAGLDVFGTEPVPADHPLIALDNVVLAPHVAWLTGETLDNSLAVAVENCRRLAAGEELLNRVV